MEGEAGGDRSAGGGLTQELMKMRCQLLIMVYLCDAKYSLGTTKALVASLEEELRYSDSPEPSRRQWVLEFGYPITSGQLKTPDRAATGLPSVRRHRRVLC